MHFGSSCSHHDCISPCVCRSAYGGRQGGREVLPHGVTSCLEEWLVVSPRILSSSFCSRWGITSMTSQVFPGPRKPSNSVSAIERKSIFFFLKCSFPCPCCCAGAGGGGLCCCSQCEQPGWWRCYKGTCRRASRVGRARKFGSGESSQAPSLLLSTAPGLTAPRGVLSLSSWD